MPNDTALMSWKLSVLLSLVFLSPGTGLAQQGLSLEAGPRARTEPPRSVGLLEALADAPPAGESAGMPRVVAVTGAAVLTGAVTSVVGGYMGRNSCSPTPETGCSDALIYGLAAGAVVGTSLGAWWGGALKDGKGSYLGSLGGALLGAGLGVGSSLMLEETDTAVYLFPIFTLLGSVIGYEVTHQWNTETLEAEALRLQPLLAVSPQSTALGLGGRF